MGRKRTPGLYKRRGFWQIDKKVFGERLCESTGTSDLEEAEKYLARRIETLRQTLVYGVRPKRTFREAATKFLLENQHMRSIQSYASKLKVVVAYIGDITLDVIHMGTLQAFIEARREAGIKTRTINHGLKVVRRLLNLAANEWIDEHGLTWLFKAPKIKLLPEHDLRKPYPLNWEEQERLFQELPPHLERMALFAVNTGCRVQEICNLQWQWEQSLSNDDNDDSVFKDASVFIVPEQLVKNSKDRLIVLNQTAKSVVDSMRDKHATHVFSYQGHPLKQMCQDGWDDARKRAGLDDVRVHDLKHTFGRRLRAAGVSFEDRQDLLGHKSNRITTHYSAAELYNLIAAANKVCNSKDNRPKLVLLKNASSRKSPASDLREAS
ncbi:MAG: tyrosine-type recombinase/integrase [Gammaproteobacteria bacterium]